MRRLGAAVRVLGCRTGAKDRRQMRTQAPSSLTRLNARPPGRHWRLSRLPPGAPVVIPDGLPLFWDARLAFARLCQVYRRVIQAPTLPDGYRWRSGRLPAVVKE